MSFSGGLDSAIGAIDLMEKGRAPLLVSHAYKGDKTYQDKIALAFKGRYSRFEVNADPHLYTGKRTSRCGPVVSTFLHLQLSAPVLYKLFPSKRR